jgi:glycyl-tRNA synthetase beta chain
VVPLEFAGIRAGNVSYGHRVLHGDRPVPIARPADYLARSRQPLSWPMLPCAAIASARPSTPQPGLLPEARWREDEALVEQVTHLTEWPTVLAGNFQPEYLALPEEVLVTVMRDHQKYFAVEDKQHALAPHFLAVLNTEVDAAAWPSSAMATSESCAPASTMPASSGTTTRRFLSSAA